MQMCAGGRVGTADKCPRYVYDIDTGLCRRTHDTRVEEDEGLDGDTVTRRPWFNQLLKGG